MNVAYTPNFLPDELLISWLSRLVVLNALGKGGNGLENLFGSNDLVISIDLPTRLADLHNRIGDSSPFDTPAQMIELGSVFPYHRPFLDMERSSRITDMLLHGSAKGLKNLIGRVANGFGANPPLRYCVKCVAGDILRFGSSYWRRRDQLPGVQCCTEHGISLACFSVPNSYAARLRLPVPAELLDASESTTNATKQQLEFSSLSRDLLYAKLAAIAPSLRQSVYRNQATANGFGTTNGKINYRKLANAIRSHYNDFDGFEHQVRLLSSANEPLSWLRALISRPFRASHPICHLLLIGFLFHSVDRFIASLPSASASIADCAFDCNAACGIEDPCIQNAKRTRWTSSKKKLSWRNPSLPLLFPATRLILKPNGNAMRGLMRP